MRKRWETHIGQGGEVIEKVEMKQSFYNLKSKCFFWKDIGLNCQSTVLKDPFRKKICCLITIDIHSSVNVIITI